MYSRLMVPLDTSETAECVLPHVKNLATLEQAQVELVSVVEPFEMPVRGGMVLEKEAVERINHQQKIASERYLKDIANSLMREGVTVRVVTLTGKVADSLIDYAAEHNIDLIIMASHGRSGINRWIWGSIAEKILHSSSVPILLIRASCFKSS